jgi:hypothetical protein
MKRTQVYLTEAQDRRLGEIAQARGTSKASVLRWVIDTALAEIEARSIILATGGICADYPDWPEWQRQVRGRSAIRQLDEGTAP